MELKVQGAKRRIEKTQTYTTNAVKKERLLYL